jgi:uncharacterized repeat protein (TIGR03803 family)
MKWITALRLRSLQQRNSIGMALGKRTPIVLALLCIAASIASASVTFKNLVFFDGTDGANPTNVILVQGIDGELYGTNANGGEYGHGTVFKISPSGTLTTL